MANSRKRDDSLTPPAEMSRGLRDLAAHLDEYAVGRGLRQTGKLKPGLSDPHVRTLVYWSDTDDTYVSLGDKSLNLRIAAREAVRLAAVVERA